jgi:hypothetical protein
LVVVVVRGRRIACRRKRATAVDDFEENWRLLAAAVDVDVVVPDIIFFAVVERNSCPERKKGEGLRYTTLFFLGSISHRSFII